SIYVAIVLAIAIAAMPAYAGGRAYVNDLLDEWVDYVELEGYEVFYTNVDRINEDHSISYYFELDPGSYMFIAEGGEDIVDIDMFVYDEDGYEIASHELDDAYPICEIEVYEFTEIEVEIAPFDFHGRTYEDFFCFVAGMNSESYYEDFGYDGYGDIDDILDYWIGWADDYGYDVIYSDSGELVRDASDYFEFELDSGDYKIYVESLYEDDDIDLWIRGEEADEIDSDERPDNYPICEFNLRRPELVEIEVDPYDYAEGNSTEYAIVIAVDGDGGILDGGFERRDYQSITDQSDYDYIQEQMAWYMDMVQDEHYEMIFDEVNSLANYESYTTRITLGRGDYIVYAEGGLGIADLDLRVYDEDGYIVAEDTMADNIPRCEFSVRHSMTFEIEIDPYEMESGWDESYYLLVVVRK
ncbi:hypothetical protein KAU08_10520, partial [bacterium]|nr:hypothetical protein [bacterium]